MGEKPDPYRELFERSADAILIIEGDRFVECNDATVRMLRYASREEMLRTHPSELSPPRQPDGRDSYEKANEMIAIAFERGSHRFEWLHRRADGEVFPVEVLLTAIEESERRLLHVVWREISDRKQLEEQLRHAQKMEAVGKLAGGIAHDFNNLLVIILGHAELLARQASGDPSLTEHTQAIQEAGERAAALVKQLLAFGRKQERLTDVVDLNQLVRHLQEMLGRLIGEDLEIETSLASEPLPVEVDPGQIEQVILNLVSNARDASPEGGVLRIETAAVELSAAGGGPDPRGPSGRCARLTVADSGVGMPPEVVERAFDPFFTTKEPGRGTGLGLSSAYAIIQQSGGTIEIDSAPASGTTVSVHIPLSATRPRDAPPRRPRTSRAKRGHGERILVVEDDPTVRRLVVRALKNRGYDPLSAADGLEGVDLYLANPGSIDLVVSDVIMPRAGGPRMLALLAERGHHPRLLFISGYSDEAISDLRRSGTKLDFLEKPFTLDQLAASVRQALDREGLEAREANDE